MNPDEMVGNADQLVVKEMAEYTATAAAAFIKSLRAEGFDMNQSMYLAQAYIKVIHESLTLGMEGAGAKPEVDGGQKSGAS